MNLKKQIVASLTLSILSIAFSSCGGSKDGSSPAVTETTAVLSVDANGNCTSGFNTEYNNVVFESSTLKNRITFNASPSEILSQAKTMQNACTKFFAERSGVTCKAQIDYQTKQVSSDDLKAPCQAADTVVKQLK